jgi:hypothetical protein
MALLHGEARVLEVEDERLVQGDVFFTDEQPGSHALAPAKQKRG